MQIRSVGIDLGKTTFYLVALGASGKVLVKKKFSQKQRHRGVQITLAAVLAKAHFWEGMAGTAINERQRMILNRMLACLKGNLTALKYAKLTKSSNDIRLGTFCFSRNVAF